MILSNNNISVNNIILKEKLPNTYNIDSNFENNKIILTIFAGRKCYMELLFNYLDKLLELNLLTEIHIWNYTRLEIDNLWLEKFKKDKNKKDKYIIFTPKNKSKKQWEEYYLYYANSLYNNDDILIKCDDDIVYIDINKFKYFISQVNGDYLYFPNIVNNDVCALIQTKNRIHNLLPIVNKNNLKIGTSTQLSKWYLDHTLANLIHIDFLNNPQKYSLNINNIIWDSRISINFFAGKIQFIKKLYTSFINRKLYMDDETYFAYICGVYNIKYIIVPYFVVVHFSFAPQNDLLLRNKYLKYYTLLAKKVLK